MFFSDGYRGLRLERDQHRPRRGGRRGEGRIQVPMQHLPLRATGPKPGRPQPVRRGWATDWTGAGLLLLGCEQKLRPGLGYTPLTPESGTLRRNDPKAV